MASPFPQITSPPQASAEVIVNEALETLEWAAVYGKDHATTTGLTWGYYGGRWGGFSVASGTFTLADNTTSYIVAARATGVTTASTATTNWSNTTDYARVYKITTLSGAVSAVEDHRAGTGGTGGGGGGSSTSSVSAWKEPVRAATTANGTLATAFANGQVIDGVTLVTADRILLKDQSTASQNGIYVVAASGSPSRADDANDPGELVGATVFVSEGTVNADKVYTQTANATITVGSTSLTFVQIAASPTPLTTKGDLYTRSTVDARLAVGANYSHLMADSAATTGNKWVLHKAVPLAYFGALNNDGSTDDTATLAAATASGVPHIDARGLNLAIASQVSLAAGQTIDLAGTTLTTAGSTITTLKADTIDDWHLIGPFTIVGAGSTTGSAKGISVVGCNRWSVRGYTGKSIKGHAFYVAPGSPSGSLRGDQGRVVDFLAFQCYHGWEDTPGAGAEYCHIVNGNVIGSGDFGVKTSAGNIGWHGGNIVDNTGDGLQMANGTNHAHGMFVGVNINHNGTYNLNAVAIINGQSFVGCHFYEKAILLDGCKGVVFTGGAIDSPTITVNSGTGSGKCRMNGVYFDNSYGNPAAVGGTDPTTLVRKDCFGPGSPGNVDIETQQKSANYTFALDDEAVDHPGADTTARTFTIPANGSVPFPIGKVLSGANGHGAGVITLAITSDTMRLAGAGTTGSRSIAADGNWAAKKIAATEWQVSGNGIT